MNRPCAPVCTRASGILLGLVIPLLALCACHVALDSLSRREAPAASEPGHPEPVLVRIAACSTGLPLATDLTEACPTSDSHLVFDVVPTNSQIALELVLAEQADLAIVGSEVDLDLLSTERPGGPGFDSQVLAIDAIGIIVHKDWPLRGLSMSELAALFGGYYLDWAELDAGSGRPDIVCREEGSAARTVFEQIVMTESRVSSVAIVMPHDRGVVEYVAQHPGAIGYASAAYADDRVKLMAIDGALPTADETRRGNYPLTHPLVLVASPRASREALSLVDFARSSQGRRIIEQRYAVPR